EGEWHASSFDSALLGNFRHVSRANESNKHMFHGKLIRSASVLLLLCGAMLVGTARAHAAPPPLDLNLDHAGVSLLVALAVALLLVGFLIQKRRARLAGNLYTTKPLPRGIPVMKRRGEVAEDQDYAKFLTEVRSGPGAGAAVTAAAPANVGTTDKTTPTPEKP